MKGGSGKDLLFGGKGADDHWGGKGADIFKFKHGDGFPVEGVPVAFDDIVWDYQDGIDKIDVPVALSGDNFVDPVGGPGAYIAYGTNGGDQVITGSFFASGVTIGEFDPTDFI